MDADNNILFTGQKVHGPNCSNAVLIFSCCCCFNISTGSKALTSQSIIPHRSQVVCTIFTRIAGLLINGIVCSNF